MKKLITLLLFVAVQPVYSATSVRLDHAETDVFDKESLQRGATTYVRYCLGCHSLKHMRYSRLAEDLEMSEDRVKSELIYAGDKIQDSMTIAMSDDNTEQWFGTKAPDLSLIARARGKDWLYSYLRGFYLDESRPFRVNNRVFKDVAMPNVLWELQGQQTAVFKTDNKSDGIQKFKVDGKGRLTPREFNNTVADLVNFLGYVGEPAQLIRLKMGKWVILYLFLFLIIAYRLKKEYWKDIH